MLSPLQGTQSACGAPAQRLARGAPVVCQCLLPCSDPTQLLPRRRPGPARARTDDPRARGAVRRAYTRDCTIHSTYSRVPRAAITDHVGDRSRSLS